MESGEKFQKDTFQFSEKTHLGVSVIARMIRVTLSLPQTVGINALVTQQLSVEGKRITLSYTLSMAQGGNSKKHIFLQQIRCKTLQFIMPDRRSQRPGSGLPGAPGACLVHLRQGPGPVTTPPPCSGGNARGRQRKKV